MHLLTCFPVTPRADDIPAIMPSPFANIPHPLAAQACRMLQKRLPALDPPCTAHSTGKMFGVLVVRDADGRIGFLSAFSGMLNGQWQIPGFVPPVFDQAEMDRFLPEGSAELAELSEQLQALENTPQRALLKKQITQLEEQRDLALLELKQQHQAAKAERKQQRAALGDLVNNPSYTAEQQRRMAALALASQRHKREAVNAAMHWEKKLQALQKKLHACERQMEQIRSTRSEKSRSLHRQVFASYVLHNHLHEQQPLTDFFADSTPPAGSGDCAGPKLLAYAHLNHWQPVALAEFWWGASPVTGIRHHGHFYPACRGKCLPILPFMLRGLNVEPEPDYMQPIAEDEPRIVYQDDAIVVVNKPAGLLSVPGKRVKDSVLSRMQQRFPESAELRLMHRLDMGTSGLLLLAKHQQANRFLHQQFLQHRVEKRYEAVLAGVLPDDRSEGEIDLPLRIDFDDRPRQTVCYQYGKPARTRWQLIARSRDAAGTETSRVWFYPLTGRTHQLRMHAAHPDGLNMAIVGDGLYGTPAERLMLHAQRLCFTHPVSREWMEFEAPTPF